MCRATTRKIKINDKRLYLFLHGIYSEILDKVNNSKVEERCSYVYSFKLWNLLEDKNLFSNNDLFISEDPNLCNYLRSRFDALRGHNIQKFLDEFNKILESIKPIEPDSIEQRFERLIDNMDRLSNELIELNEQIKFIRTKIK